MRGTQCECSNFKIIYLQRRDAVKVISCLNIPCVYSTVCRLKLDEWLASCVIKVLTRSEMCLWWSGDSTRRGFVEPVCAYCRVLIGCEHIMVLECDHWCFLPKRISTSVIGSPVVFRGHCWWTNELAVGLTWNCGFLADQIFGWKSTPSMSCHDFFIPLRYAEWVRVVMKHRHVEQFRNSYAMIFLLVASQSMIWWNGLSILLSLS